MTETTNCQETRSNFLFYGRVTLCYTRRPICISHSLPFIPGFTGLFFLGERESEHKREKQAQTEAVPYESLLFLDLKRCPLLRKQHV